MKISFLTNGPFVTCGYGQIIKNILPRINKEHESCLITNYGIDGGQKMPKFWEGVTFYGKGQGGFDESLVPNHMKDFGSDVLIPIYDVWAWNKLHHELQNNMLPWVPYAPVDTEDLNPMYRDVLSKAFLIIPMSQHSEDVILKHFPGKTLPHIPPGVDLDIMKPQWETKEEKAKIKRGMGFDEDVFLITMMGDIKGFRKQWAENLEGIKKFRDANPNVKIGVYIQTSTRLISPHDFDINKLVTEIGLKDVTRVVDTYKFVLGVSDEEMSKVYNASDVFLQASYGEGFGMMFVEAAACFEKNTLVRTMKGYKKIIDVKKGDLVLTHQGNWKKVLRLVKKKSPDELISIRPYLSEREVLCTKDHEWYVYKDGSNQWIKAGELVGDELLIVPKQDLIKDDKLYIDTRKYAKKGKNQYGASFIHPRTKVVKNTIIDDEIAIMFGFYISEGGVCISKGEVRDLSFTFNIKEDSFSNLVSSVLSRLGFNPKCFKRIDQNSQVVRGTFTSLSRYLVENFGHTSKNKRIPQWILEGPINILQNVIKGCWLGDGCTYIDKKLHAIASYTTKSRELAYNLRDGLLRFGIIVDISYDKKHDRYFVRINGKDSEKFCKIFNIGIIGDEGNFSQKNTYVDENYGYVKIRKINKVLSEEDYVYDLTVEDDHSYCVYGYAVHNCGTPSIGTRFTSMTQTVRDGITGYLVDVSTLWWDQSIAKRAHPDINDIARKLELIHRKGSTSFMKECVRFAKDFDWNKLIEEKWIPTLKLIEEKLRDSPYKIPPPSNKLKENSKVIFEV